MESLTVPSVYQAYQLKAYYNKPSALLRGVGGRDAGGGGGGRYEEKPLLSTNDDPGTGRPISIALHELIGQRRPLAVYILDCT